MRFIHVSDLHIGQRLCDRDRYDEHQLYFSWLLDRCRELKADYLVITGDIFDTASPSNRALGIYYRFLAGLTGAGLSGALVIGGNHDSPSSLSAPRELLESFNVFVRGAKSDEPADDVILLRDPQGGSVACGLVPYLRERDIRSPKGGESAEERDRGIKEGVRDHYRRIMEEARSRNPDAVLLTGHLFAAGYESGKGQRDLYVGNLGHISMDLLPADADYTALGHIHIPRAIGEKCGYAGSPIPMDFGEAADKQLSVIDIPGKRSSVPVPEFRRLLRFYGTPQEILEAVEVLDAAGIGGKGLSPWAEALISTPVPDPVAFGEIEKALAEKGIELLRIRTERTETEVLSMVPGRSLEEISPKEMFKLRCEGKGVEMTRELSLAFDELLLQAADEGGESDED